MPSLDRTVEKDRNLVYFKPSFPSWNYFIVVACVQLSFWRTVKYFMILFWSHAQIKVITTVKLSIQCFTCFVVVSQALSFTCFNIPWFCLYAQTEFPKHHKHPQAWCQKCFHLWTGLTSEWRRFYWSTWSPSWVLRSGTTCPDLCHPDLSARHLTCWSLCRRRHHR